MSDPLSSSFASLRFDVFRTAPRTPYSCGVSLLGLLAKIKCSICSYQEEAMSEVRVPYADTLRLIVPESRREEVTRGFFVEHVVRGIMKMSDVEVLACQEFKAQRSFDVTFRSYDHFMRASQRVTEQISAGAAAVRGFRLVLASVEYTVVVHVFNPFVDERDVAQFLKRYCSEVRGGEKVMEDGLWTGRRRYRVKFRVDKRGLECLPPRSFTLGPHKGRLFVPAIPQSASCWTCNRKGHESRECTALRCFQCDVMGHLAKDCTKPKTCSLCGTTEHLFFDCPLRARSYAKAAGQRSGAEGASVASGVAPALVPAREKKGKDEKLMEGSVTGSGDGGVGSIPSAGAGPHGEQDGRNVCEQENKGAGGSSKEAETRSPEAAGAGAEFPASQEEEMVAVSELVRLKRPLVGVERGGTPVQRPRTMPGVSTSNKFLPLQVEEEEEESGEGLELELEEADPDEVEAVVSDLIDLAGGIKK